MTSIINRHRPLPRRPVTGASGRSGWPATAGSWRRKPLRRPVYLLAALLTLLALGGCVSAPKPESRTQDVVVDDQLIGQLTLTENYKAQVVALNYRTSGLIEELYPWLQAYRFRARCQTLNGQTWSLDQPATQSTGARSPTAACRPGSFSYQIYLAS